MDVISPLHIDDSDVPDAQHSSQDYFSMLSNLRRQYKCQAIERMQAILNDLYTDKSE